jgi:cysteinyl-tRNA synthetase
LDFSDEALQGAKAGYEKLANTIRNLQDEIQRAEKEKRISGLSLDLTLIKKQFFDAMDDDFNAPLAIGSLFELIREINQNINSEKKLSVISLSEINGFLNEAGKNILGIIPSTGISTPEVQGIDTKLIEILISTRQRAKQEKSWWAADLIRKELDTLGIQLEDKKDGSTSWRKV